MKASASAPASSANLGPGYDVVALALDLRCRVHAERAEKWLIRSADAPVDDGAVSLVQRVASRMGVSGSWDVDVASAIPIARGLGSSAALIVATAAALRAASGLPSGRSTVYPGAADVEGHPDNVAAALWGGAVAVGPRRTVRHLEVHPSLRVVVAVPDAVLLTADARRATAGPVPSAVAARTAARAVFLVEGLRTADPELLAEAAGDELHELRRAPLSPLTANLVTAAREAGALHAAWSGAGPSALALSGAAGITSIRSAWEEILSSDGGEVLELHIAATGLVVESGGPRRTNQPGGA